ncbi:MAG: peptide-methionine (R)-S-oxide reductase, partial [Bacteroidales bacterium]|nr:peptide-methionine (R)-S-oxide reductase [Bacteroidales bacterium]
MIRAVGIIIMLNTMMILSSYAQKDNNMANQDKEFQKDKPDSAWKQELTPMQYHVLREKGTEKPYSGKYDDHYKKGTYHCAACGEPLFEWDTKYNAGCGWPSFWEPKLKDKVKIRLDKSHG